MTQITTYKFEEVLNDLMDYFILGDPDHLWQYKQEHQLPNDLLTEFTTQETGDTAVENGVMIPMIGIENHPYTIYFNLSGEDPELLKPGNNLQHRQDGYCMNVTNGGIYLYTIPYLKDFTEEKLRALKTFKHATIAIENGWYTVSVLGGLTKQPIEIVDVKGETQSYESMEPTFEFLISPSDNKPKYTANFMYRFAIKTE